MKKKLYFIFKYLFIFCFFLSWNLIIQKMTMDEVWSYGFSYNISQGLIPYEDFNMVIPPLYPILFSIPLLISSNILVFHITNSILLCFIYYFLEKLLNKNKYIPLLFMMFPLSIIFPNYNLFLFLLFLIIIYLEKEYSNKDYIIGFIIGLIILTKHSVGVFFIIPSIIYYRKNYKKLLKRFIGLIVPCFIFLIYLIINSNLFEFLNLCVLGLFDFAGDNSNLFNIYFFISIILIVFNLVKLKDTKKRCLYLYSLVFTSILIPLFDLYHFMFYVVSLIVVLLIDYNFKIKLNISLLFKGIILGIFVISTYYNVDFSNYPNNINKFQYRYLDNDYILYTQSINSLICKYSDKNIVFLSNDGYYFKIINNIRITYYDLLNSGNLGYNGNELIIKDISSNKSNFIFFISMDEYNNLNSQLDKKITKYVLDNGTKIDTIYKFSIYELE